MIQSSKPIMFILRIASVLCLVACQMTVGQERKPERPQKIRTHNLSVQKKGKHIDPPNIVPVKDRPENSMSNIPINSLPASMIPESTEPWICKGDFGLNTHCENENGWVPLSKLLTSMSATELIRRFGMPLDIPLRYENQDEAPLAITDAKLTAIKIVSDQQYLNSPAGSEYSGLQAGVVLMNNSNQRIIALGLYFTDSGARPFHYARPVRASIGPDDTFTFSKKQEDYSSYWIGNPDRLIIKVAGVEFEDGSKWSDTLSGRAGPDGF